jgi:hypothetical protein
LHREVKISREGVCNVVGEARNVVEARDVAVVALVNAKQSEEIRWRRVGSGAAFALPKSGVEVVALADHSALARVKGLCDGLKVNESPRELQVGVGDGACRIFGCDEATSDVVWPLKSPEDWDVGFPALPRLEVFAREPDATGAFA